MTSPTNLAEAIERLHLIFHDITGLRPTVTLGERDEQDRPTVIVSFPGDDLFRAMQVEAYVLDRGDSIRQRSQVRDGRTVLVYQVEPKQQQFSGYHLQTVKPPRVVPAAERHKWSRVPQRGQTATCSKCGCVKCYRLNYDTVYRLKGQDEILTERPACTGPAV